jgi:lipoprotein-releasing system ATP-binding protein
MVSETQEDTLAAAAAGIAKSYSTPSGDLVVLKEITLDLRRGDSVAIMGNSGSGKSTLLNVLGTLDAPTAGTLAVGGVDPFALSEPELAAFRNAEIGFVFQDHHLLPQCTVLENVLVPCLAAPAGLTAEKREAAGALLERVGLTGRIEHRPAQLSGGERQRTSIVRALINAPRLVLADEPTGNVDQKRADELADLFTELVREHDVALVVATHSESLAKRFDAVRRLSQGVLE